MGILWERCQTSGCQRQMDLDANAKYTLYDENYPDTSDCWILPVTFLWFWPGPLVYEKGTLKAEGYLDILDNSMLPTLWQQFGEGPFLFEQDRTSVQLNDLLTYGRSV